MQAGRIWRGVLDVAGGPDGWGPWELVDRTARVPVVHVRISAAASVPFQLGWRRADEPHTVVCLEGEATRDECAWKVEEDDEPSELYVRAGAGGGTVTVRWSEWERLSATCT